MTARRLRVLESFRRPTSTTNPYLHLLLDALRERCDVSTFSWRHALLGRYDVLHLHWPEVLLRASSGPKTWARRALFLALIVRSRLLRVAIVRTMHNPSPHERQSTVDRILLTLCDRATTWRIGINDSGAHSDRTTIAPHGHYREWFVDAPARHTEAVADRLAFIGLVRPYKNVPALLRAFSELPRDTATLQVRGDAPSTVLRDEVLALASSDPRVDARIEHLGDDEVVACVRAARVVVLPYRDLTNSGVALLALSLERPVLVPRNDVTDRLAAEVGERWVIRYDGALTASVLAHALESPPPRGEPDLGARSWSGTAALHCTAFDDAVQCRAGHHRAWLRARRRAR